MNINLNCSIEDSYKNAFEHRLVANDAHSDHHHSGRQDFPDLPSSSFNTYGFEDNNRTHRRVSDVNEHRLNANNNTTQGNDSANIRPNQTEGNDATLNEQQIDPQQLMAQPILVPEVEAKLYLKRKLGFFIATIIFSIALLMMTKGTITKRRVFSAVYLYCTYRIIESIRRAKNRTRETWRRNEDSLAIIWLVSFKITLLVIDQRVAGIIKTSVLAALPLLVYSILYIIKSEAPKIVKLQKILADFALTTQAFLITLKLDGVITWHWNVIFIISFIFLLVLAVYLALFTSHLLVMLLLDYFPLYEQPQNINLRVQSIGVLWRMLVNGMGIFLFVGILGINTAATQNDFEYLHFAALSSIYLNAILVIFTLFKFKRLVEYVKLFGLTGIIAVNPDDLLVSEPQNRVLQFRTEKKESYFLMVSPTYFMPLNNEILSKNMQKVQRIKDIITGLTPKSNPCSQKYNQLHNEGNEFVEIEMNKGIGASQNKSISGSNIPSIELEGEEGEPRKQRLSTADTDAATDSNRGSKDEVVEEEHLCYVCCVNPSNAILMDCGHGGICYQCAIFTLQKKNQCMECRAKVDAIYRVNPKTKGSNMLKAVEVTNIVEVTAS